ncbi:MAG: nitroreductase family deazaflavin-dependent oxidoreductase [Anaerolineae bacterium]|nr:nitroreductase family deazaflavin-dependent oxidoreductase [Anaerolineae bacterium]
MVCKIRQQLEKKFFRTLNQTLEPLIRLGVGSPALAPVGAIVMETKGRKSGRTYNIPVLASEWSDLLVVGTVRERSQWLKNLAATPQIRVWLRGRPRLVTAYVVGEAPPSPAGVSASSASVQTVIDLLKPISERTGAGFAVLALEQRA